MANVELKIDFKDGEALFGEQLNNNFKAIKAALEAANKIAWQDNLDDEIIAFKGTTEEVEHRPIINGQLVYDVEQGFAYIDIITYLEEEGYQTLKPQRIKLSGGGTNNNIPLLSNIDLSEINKPGVYMVDHDTTTDNMRVGDTYAAPYMDYYIVVRKYTDETMFQYSWDNTMSYAYFRMLNLDENGNTISVSEWTKTDYMIPNIKTGDYADILAEGTYIVDKNLADRLSTLSSIGNTYNKLMYVVKSGGSTRANVQQTLVDGFDIYVRAVYTDASYTTAQSATDWEKRTIGGVSEGLLNKLFPIGKVEVFFDNEDHSDYLGFAWERTSIGKVPVGIDSSDTDFNTIGKTGGSKYTEKHAHGMYTAQGGGLQPFVLAGGGGETKSGYWHDAPESNNYTGPQVMTDTYGNGTSGNLQPYEVMAFWKRIG